ncbi:PKD domain-containing protein [candidate division KSB1 bacterium]|nr:PKD domain-containing protein [candidate division KSB1 bacterium]
MRIFSALTISLAIIIILIIACEKHNDPFSSLNKIPTILEFSFASESLKYKKGEPYKINLKYQDDENQKLTATFRFLSGHGDIFHSSFTEIEADSEKVIFEAPGVFDGRLNFIPDTTGKVEIELVLSDRVKLSTKKIETFFFFNLLPIPKFTYRILSTVSPYVVEFNATETVDPDSGGIENLYWWFDDGTPWIPRKATIFNYSYNKSGRYTVKLKVEDSDGGIDSTENVVSTSNQPPLAMLQVEPIKGEAPLTIQYTATNSFDPDGQIVAYRIDFDDGNSSLDSIGTHKYTYDNNYRIRLRVQDNLGQTDTTGVSVLVATPPIAVLKVTPQDGPFPLDCVIDGTDSYDKQGGKLKHQIYINGTLKYENIDSVIHNFEAPELYLVRLIVTSERNGLTDEDQKSISVINIPPNADFTWQPEIPQHQTPVTYTSISSDSNLTDEISYYKWTFPGGTVIEGKDKAIIIQPFDAGFSPYNVKLEVWDKYKGTKFEGYDYIIKKIPK